MPRLNGVPIGDCREPTAAERAALGCPETPPRDGDPCDLAQGVTCAYSLSTKESTAYQDLHLCSNDPNRTWWELLERCGEICTDGGAHVLDVDAADCTSRPMDDCEIEGTLYAYAPSGRTLLAEMLRKVIQDCAPGTSDLSVTLELAGGCATRFSTTREFSESATACLRDKLGHLRFACGEHLPCVSYNEFTT